MQELVLIRSVQPMLVAIVLVYVLCITLGALLLNAFFRVVTKLGLLRSVHCRSLLLVALAARSVHAVNRLVLEDSLR